MFQRRKKRFIISLLTSRFLKRAAAPPSLPLSLFLFCNFSFYRPLAPRIISERRPTSNQFLQRRVTPPSPLGHRGGFCEILNKISLGRIHTTRRYIPASTTKLKPPLNTAIVEMSDERTLPERCQRHSNRRLKDPAPKPEEASSLYFPSRKTTVVADVTACASLFRRTRGMQSGGDARHGRKKMGSRVQLHRHSCADEPIQLIAYYNR